MLLFENSEMFRGVGNDIYDAGYGLSVLRDPKGFRVMDEDLSVTIEVLEDWGWTGEPANRPEWMGAPPAREESVRTAPSTNGGGISEADMQAYVDLNQGLSEPFPADLVRGKERHGLRKRASEAGLAQGWHGHVGPVDDIPIKEDP